MKDFKTIRALYFKLLPTIQYGLPRMQSSEHAQTKVQVTSFLISLNYYPQFNMIYPSDP